MGVNVSNKKREYIKSIKLDKANLVHISDYLTINGSLLIDLERVMQEYATECVKASLEKARDNVDYIMYADGVTKSNAIDRDYITSPDNIVLV